MQKRQQPHSRTCSVRVLASAVCAALALFASTAESYYISSISVSPDDPIAEGSPITLDISLWTPTSPISLFDNTITEINGTSIDITIFSSSLCELSAPVPICAAVVGSLSETIQLGALAAGDYTVDVETIRLDYFGFTTSWDTEQAMFTVVPEPSSALLIGLGLAWVAGSRRQP